MTSKVWDIFLAKISRSKLPDKSHPKCLGFTTNTIDGYKYDCGYNTSLICEDCKYGMGRKDPEVKSNKIK